MNRKYFLNIYILVLAIYILVLPVPGAPSPCDRLPRFWNPQPISLQLLAPLSLLHTLTPLLFSSSSLTCQTGAEKQLLSRSSLVSCSPCAPWQIPPALPASSSSLWGPQIHVHYLLESPPRHSPGAPSSATQREVQRLPTLLFSPCVIICSTTITRARISAPSRLLPSTSRRSHKSY